MPPTIKLLYAEDNPSDADLTRVHFAKHAPDFELEIVNNGRRCLDRLRAGGIDLLLLDYHLPDMDGLDVLKALFHPDSQVPVVVVTGAGDEDLVVKALRLGAASYVSKQSKYLETLPALLREVIEEHRRNRSQGPSAVSPRRILYLEHWPMDIDLLQQHLAELAPHFVLDAVHTCAEALARLEQAPDYDLALVDLRMPDMSGLDFVREAKRRHLHLPSFVVISGKGDEATAVAALKLGAADYVTKREGYLNRLTFAMDQAIAHDRLNHLNQKLRVELAERKWAEELLRSTSMQLDLLLRSARVGTWHSDLVTGRFQWSPQMFDLLGLDPGSVKASIETWRSALHPEDIEPSRRRIDQALEQHTVLDNDCRVVLPSGQVRWINSVGEGIYDDHGQPIQMVGICQDVTARKQAEEANERFRLGFDNSAVAQAMTSLDGRFLRVNEALVRMLGYSPAELESMTYNEVTHPDDRAAISSARTALVAGQETIRFEKRYVARDGATVWVDVNVALVRDSRKQPQYVIGTYIDITERKHSEAERRKLEEQLWLSQKLEAIGSLAGGIAHDFNNLLSLILSYTSFAMERLQEGDPASVDLIQVKKAGERAATLIQQLLAFSRKQVLQPVTLSLNEIASEFETMLQRILGEDIEFSLVLAPDLGMVRADPGQIEQVLMNLAVNARDAMPDGGKLTIETANVVFAEKPTSHNMQPGPYVLLAVTDTGCGMDARTQARVFEPFFTTKEMGKGTGLGLSTVYGIVKQSGGYIWVASEPGMGTTFKIYLPRDFASVPTTVAKPRRAAQRTGGTETILAVEDEEGLRLVTSRILDAAGYKVLTAADGYEALMVSVEHRGDIQLLLTDVVMPRMSGRVLAQELAKIRPAIKVLYMSGYADNALASHGVIDASTHFLGKPFSADALLCRVRAVLDGLVTTTGANWPAIKDEVEETPLHQDAPRALPYDVLASLRKAAIAANYDDIVEIVATIAGMQPGVAAEVRRMADRFDYDGIQEFLR